MSQSASQFGDATENVLAVLLAHARDRVVVLSARGEIAGMSASAGDLFGQVEPGANGRALWSAEHHGAFDTALSSAANGVEARFDAAARDGSAARAWVLAPVRNHVGAVTHVLAVECPHQDGDRDRLQRAEEQGGHADDVAREMRHRFKNQLAVIGAIAKLLARHTEGARELAAKLEQKLVALAQAQDLLTDTHGAPIPAPEAIARVLGASAAGDRVKLTGCPPSLLGDEAIQQLALVLGELQTNALKYGALAGPGGRIELAGTADDTALTLRWEEFCPEPVTPGAADGGGFQLIRRIGMAGSRQANIGWNERGIAVEFHLRTQRN